jgi:hypothetical protein
VIAAPEAPAVDPLVRSLAEKFGPREAAELYEALDPRAVAGVAGAPSRGPNQSIGSYVADLRRRARVYLETSARRHAAHKLGGGVPVPRKETAECDVILETVRLYAAGAGAAAVAEFVSAARAALAAAESERAQCERMIIETVDQIARAVHQGEALARHYPELHDLAARLAEATRRIETWPAVVDRVEAALPRQIGRVASEAVGATGHSDAYRLAEVLTNWSATPEAARNRQADPVVQRLKAEAENVEIAVEQLGKTVPSATPDLLDGVRRALTVDIHERLGAHRATIADKRAVAERLLAGDVSTWRSAVADLPADQPQPSDPPPVAAAKALRRTLEQAGYAALAAPGPEAVLSILEALP